MTSRLLSVVCIGRVINSFFIVPISSVDMSVFRKNTLVVDFSVLPKRPDAGEVQQFLEKKVKLKLADTTTIQLHNIRNCVYIETIDSETALRYEKANHCKHTITCNNKEFKIPVYVDSEAVTVRVHDLPTHTPHLTVTDFMGQYGVVLSISRERWKHHFPGFYNGVRVLRMKLSRTIPSCVTIDGETTLVTYKNQPKTCHHCGNAAHPKKKCTKTPITSSSNTKTPSPPAPSGPPLDGDKFPSLSSTSNEEPQVRQNKNNDENKTTSDNGDDGNDDDDHNGDDDDNDDDSDSSDTNEFIEATNRKRQISKRKANETKKKCLSQGSQNLVQNCNRFQALVQLDPTCPSAAELEAYLNRVKDKQKALC